MAATPPSTFGSLLRRHRSEAGLTQEELAERAELSVRAISDLERGVNINPRPFTVRRLADALDLAATQRTAFCREGMAALQSTESSNAMAVGRFLGSLPECDLVGREQEIARITTILDSVADGERGHFVLLAGEPASGKTRLLQEVTLRARGRGFVVLTGRCIPAELNSPYHPLLEAFEPSASTIPIGTDLGDERGWKAFRDLTAGVGADRQVSFALGNALRQASQSAPVALVLDDLQWADRHTLSVLHGLAGATRSSRTLLAGAFSDVKLSENHPELAVALQSLGRDRLIETIGVRRLSGDETATLVGELLGQSEVSEEFAGFVYRRTKGSPRLIDELIRSLGGRLDLEGEIGAGSMGRVFRAYDRMTGRTVAAKLVLARAGIDLDDLLRFQQEGAILRSLDHPNIVRIYDSFAEEHVGCIVMELLEGRSLARELDDGPLDLTRAKSIALQTADALSFAHSYSIVHRDVKPDNIMIVGEDRVKVTDFGIARILSVDTMMGTVATTGMRVGTPLYMAPEQVKGKNIDGRSDVYGFGAVLYHMVTGRPPFDGSDALEIAVKQMQEQPARPSAIRKGVPADWDALILKALNKEPRRRFQSMSEMKRDIETLGTESAARPDRLAPKRWLAAGGVLLLILALIGSMLGYSAAAGNGGGVTLGSYLAGAAALGQLNGTVLVAKQGKIILDRGYGYANRAAHIRNGATTEYGLANATTTALLTADALQGTQAVSGIDPKNFSNMITRLGYSICNKPYFQVYGGACPAKWRRVTISNLVNGTSGLADYGTGQSGRNILQSIGRCSSLPVKSRDAHRVDYSSCNDALLGIVAPTIFNTNWTAEKWLPAGIIPGGPGPIHFNGSHSRLLAHELFDGQHDPRLAVDYTASGQHRAAYYNDYYAAYTSARSLYSYDRLLFSGKLMSPANTRRLTSARGIAAPPDPGIDNVQWADGWKVGHLFGKKTTYTAGSLNGYQTANFWFPGADAAVIVMANTAATDALNVAEHAAAFVLPGKQALAAATSPASIFDLEGTYVRRTRPADASPMAAQMGSVPTAVLGFPPMVSGRSRAYGAYTMLLRINRRYFILGAKQPYAATNSGTLSLFGQPPGGQDIRGCTPALTGLVSTGYYHWALLGKVLSISEVSDSSCRIRAELVSGTWTRVRPPGS